MAAAEAQSKTEGLRTHDAERIQPMLGRGVLLDVAAARGVEVLASRHRIGRQDLEAAAEYGKVGVRAGDVVLVRTGWIKRWPDQRTYYTVQSGQAGLDLEGARWLTDRGVRCIGSDNFAVEYIPPHGHPVHTHCLVEK